MEVQLVFSILVEDCAMITIAQPNCYMGASYLLFYGVTAQLTILNIFVLSLLFSFFVSGMAVSNKPWKKIGIFLRIWSFFEPKFHRRPECLPWTYTKGMNEQWGLLMNHHLQWIT